LITDYCQALFPNCYAASNKKKILGEKLDLIVFIWHVTQLTRSKISDLDLVGLGIMCDFIGRFLASLFSISSFIVFLFYIQNKNI